MLGYHSLMLSLRHLADQLSAQHVPSNGPASDASVQRVASVQDADARSLVFAESESALREAAESNAAAILTTPQLAVLLGPCTKALLLVAQPRLAFAQAAILLRTTVSPSGVHPTAIVPANATLGKNLSIGPYTVLGENARIGDGTRIGAGCAIADGVLIGSDCRIFPNVAIYSGVTLGARVTVHAGCVLGSDGFGYVRDAIAGTYTQFPQQGTLVVEDDVEIGANTTIDRGALQETRIERGTKLDNLVHIGHNVRVGRNVAIAAQTGISGSSTVGEGAVLGGQVGIGEHATVGPHVILGGGAGVLSKKRLRGPGLVFWGRPAQPLREYLKGLAMLARLARKSKE
ncbi:MAG: UDP-3-O-(3-hydroxymyristoyl)glucosamine N-acyltransferase [Acidobacteriaceae bacterium]